jgi:hypothetical protein
MFAFHQTVQETRALLFFWERHAASVETQGRKYIGRFFQIYRAGEAQFLHNQNDTIFDLHSFLPRIDPESSKERLRALYGRTVPHKAVLPANLREGDYCEACDFKKCWYMARVLLTCKRSVFVHYIDWPWGYDEWLERSGTRLSAVGTRRPTQAASETFSLLK